MAGVRRSKFLPEGGRLYEKDLSVVSVRLRDAVKCVNEHTDGLELRRDARARELWRSEYRRLSAGHPGVLGMVTARAEAQVTRLSCLYALGDGSSVVRVEHLQAGLALWRYCFQSAGYLFGDGTGVDLADRIRDELRQASTGLTRTQLSDCRAGLASRCLLVVRP